MLPCVRFVRNYRRVWTTSLIVCWPNPPRIGTRMVPPWLMPYALACERSRHKEPGMLSGKIQSVGVTDVGKVREHNEDTIGVDGDIGLLVLADGMGGYNAGEVASGIAVKTIMSLVKESFEQVDMLSPDPETGLS